MHEYDFSENEHLTEMEKGKSGVCVCVCVSVCLCVCVSDFYVN